MLALQPRGWFSGKNLRVSCLGTEFEFFKCQSLRYHPKLRMIEKKLLNLGETYPMSKVYDQILTNLPIAHTNE